MKKEEEIVLIAVRREGRILWFQCNRAWWIMDLNKWRNDQVQRGEDAPEFDDAYRFGIKVVNEKNAGEFLARLKDYEMDPDRLTVELAIRLKSATSWSEVHEAFPMMFIDFDRREVAAFYSEGVAMERYVPDEWTGRFIDFVRQYPEDVFPTSSKFWAKPSADLVASLKNRDTRVH